MRRLLSMVLILLSCFTAVYANAAPSYWKGYPGSEILAIDDNTSIQINHEYLEFDFSDKTQSDKGYALGGRLSASYTMVNTDDNAKHIQMVFPFVDSLNHLSVEDIMISVDKESIPFELLLKDESMAANGRDQASRAFAASDFTRSERSLTDYGFADEGYLYRISVEAKKDLFFELSYAEQHNATTIFPFGEFNSYAFDDKTDGVELGAWLNTTKTFELLSLADPVTLHWKAYASGDRKEEIASPEVTVQVETIKVKEFLLMKIRPLIPVNIKESVDDVQLENILIRHLNDTVKNHGFEFDLGLSSLAYENRIMGLLYEVEFEPGQEREITVCYRINGTMDARETVEPVYGFEYFLSPAAHWKAFSDLTIKIIPPEKAPYVIESSVDFTSAEDGSYEYRTNSLPNTELHFSLYKNERITMRDKIAKALSAWSYLIPLLLPVLSIVALATLVLLILKNRKNPKHRD